MFLGAFNYIGANSNIETAGKMPVFVDFFIDKGLLSILFARGFSMRKKLKLLIMTIRIQFHPLLIVYKGGKLGRMITEREPFDDGNSVEYVEKASDLSHILSYVVLGENTYLAGYGRGSSFLLETYFDGGII